MAYRDRFASIRLSWPDHASHSATTLADLRTICRELRTAMPGVGDIANHPLRGIGAVTWSPKWRDELSATVDELVRTLPEFRQTANLFAALFGREEAGADLHALRTLMAIAGHMTKPQARAAHLFLTERGQALRETIDEFRHLQTTAQVKRRALLGRYRDAVLERDPASLLQQWTAATGANFVVRGGRQKAVRAQLQPFAEAPIPDDPSGDLAVLVELAELSRRAQRLAPMIQQLGVAWGGLATPIDNAEELVSWAYEARRLCERAAMAGHNALALQDRMVRLLGEQPQSFAAGGAARAAYDQMRALTAAVLAIVERLGGLVGTAGLSRLLAGPSWIEAVLETVSCWKAHLHQAPAWLDWTATVARAGEAGLGPLARELEAGTLARDELERAYEVAYARWWIDRIVTDDPALRGFIATRHEDAIERFRAADVRVGEIAKQIVRARLGGDVPPPTAFGTDPEWGTLARELTKKARHKPLRKLFGEIPTALTRLTPCVMMSPLSIAQYLPPDARPFDVVLFDEASQIPVWDAIGIIARGEQVIVVGDPQQLPPTSFGERGVDDVEDGTDVTDQESILDECLAANVPARRLDWHYRSRHESLIAFSNHAYYGGRLVTFPSPVTEDRAVRYVHVPGGVYERGTSRVNRKEAAAVVADVVRRLKEPGFAADRRSIGVVTFNGEQQRLIENLLDQERRSDPTLEPFFDPARWHEPVFVKNLENVQGDERDVTHGVLARRTRSRRSSPVPAIGNG